MYSNLRRQDEITLALKELYKSYGYDEYKLTSFEEYSLYAENRNFLSGGEIVTFSSGGKLMALRPDVTLSVVKNFKNLSGVKKLFYEENVYRPNSRGAIAESSQIGVEILGEVDCVAEAEAVELMIKSLLSFGTDCVLATSHIGVTGKILSFLGLRGEDKAFALGCLAEKNAHDFKKFARENNIPPEKVKIFLNLINLPREPKAAIKGLKEMEVAGIDGEIAELEEVLSLAGNPDEAIIDFSVTGNADYYNGLIFKGYINGVPRAALSGGRYDNLVKKFDGDRQAIGFALYLGELAPYFSAPAAEECEVICYSPEEGRSALERASRERAAGKRVKLMPKGEGEQND